MRAFWVLLFSIACRSSAQLDSNPISHPKEGEIITAGSTFNITWTPNQGVIISIELWNGFPIASYFNGANCYIDQFVSTCSELFSNVSNTGSMQWHVPANAPISDQYYLDIYVPNPAEGGPFYYVTGNFSIHPASTTSQIPTVSSTASTASTASAASATISSAPCTATATVTGSPPNQGSGPSPGVIGGAVGGVVGIALAVGLGFAIFTLRRKKKDVVESRSSGRTDYGRLGGKIELRETVSENHDERVGGRIRYPEPDYYDSGIVGGRLRSNN